MFIEKMKNIEQKNCIVKMQKQKYYFMELILGVLAEFYQVNLEVQIFIFMDKEFIFQIP